MPLRPRLAYLVSHACDSRIYVHMSTGYRDMVDTVPATESLKVTTERVASFYHHTVVPALKEGKNVMVVAHGNTLRALVKLIDSVSDQETLSNYLLAD